MAGPWEAYQEAKSGPWDAYRTPEASDAAPAKKTAPAPAYDPTEGMSFGDRLNAGAGKAMVDTYRGLKQLLGVGDQDALQKEVDESKKLDAPLMRTGGGVTGNIVGNMATWALPGIGVARAAGAVPAIAGALQAFSAARPVLSGIAAGAGTGAAQGALEPTATGDSRLGNMAIGAGIGAAGGAIPGLLARVVKPSSSDDVARLVNEGVRLTPGQATGGALKRIEDAATSVPVVGDVIKRAQTRGIEDFNRAGFNRALAPIGEKVGKDFNIGREGIAAVESKIGAAYDRALNKIVRVDLDDQFGAEVGKLVGMTAELGEGPAKQFGAILKNRVLDKITPAGTMSAETMKAVESELGRQVRQWSGSSDAAQRGLASALREVQSSLRGAVERSAGPAAAGDLKAANTAWANFVRIQDAASRLGAKDGVFTPAQLLNAVKSGDKSVRKSAFARGDALMQDLAESAKNVMPSSVPDSGTASRIFTGGGIGGLLGNAMGVEPSTMALAASAMLPYTKFGGGLTLAALTKRPEFAGTLAEILRQGAPAGGVAAGLMAPLLAGPQ